MRPGDQVAGYRIESVLGRGGMGVVYEATQLSLNRNVALKVLPVDLRHDPVFRTRFRREGELQASLDHPNIVTVYEAGETDDVLYLAMRRVRGSTLKQLIAAHELDGERAVLLLAPIADALDHAHTAGLTHRDIKPQNILVGDGDHPYLADFGLTRSATEPGLTKTGQFVGTADYVAPEQIRGEQASVASDIYSLAAVLYECFTGQVPYPRPSDHAVLFSHVSEPPPRVTEHRPELPAALDDVIGRGMAKEPSERPSSASELVADAVRALTTGERPQTTRVTVPPAVGRPAPTRRRMPWRRLAVGLGLVLAVGLGAALASVLGGEGGSTPKPRSATATPAGDGTGERRGDPITMRTVPGGDVVANAQLINRYGGPEFQLRLQLAPVGPAYHLLLFDDLDAVRRFETVPESAMAVLAGGANGALKTGDADPGTTGSYDDVAMPANFRDYRYFGVARADGRTRTLEAYDAVDRLADPS